MLQPNLTNMTPNALVTYSRSSKNTTIVSDCWYQIRSIFSSKLAAYWPVPIHAVAPLAYTVAT